MLDCARRAGSRALEGKALHRIACSRALGPTPVAQAIPQLTQMLEETDSAYARSKLLLYLAELEATRGRYADARGLAKRSMTLMRELGDRRELALGEALRCSAIELWAGDFEASERFARSGCETLTRMGLSGYLCSLLVCIIEAVIPQGKTDEASQILSAAASLLTNDQDLDAIERQGRARALIALASGDPATAQRAATIAVETSMRADYVCEQASNWLVLAEANDAAGHHADAREAAAQALAIAESKGHALFTWRARSIVSAHKTAHRAADSASR
jgi:hypothetical protein